MRDKYSDVFQCHTLFILSSDSLPQLASSFLPGKKKQQEIAMISLISLHMLRLDRAHRTPLSLDWRVRERI